MFVRSGKMTQNNLKHQPLLQSIEAQLCDMQADNILLLNIADLSDFADTMIICSGRTKRHTQAIANRLLELLHHKEVRPTGIEGVEQQEWILIDLGNIIVHIMLDTVRDYYGLEKLWYSPPSSDTTPSQHA